MATALRTGHEMPSTASAYFAMLEDLRRELRAELAARLHELRTSPNYSDRVDVSGIEALCASHSSADISAATVDISRGRCRASSSRSSGCRAASTGCAATAVLRSRRRACGRCRSPNAAGPARSWPTPTCRWPLSQLSHRSLQPRASPASPPRPRRHVYRLRTGSPGAPRRLDGAVHVPRLPRRREDDAPERSVGVDLLALRHGQGDGHMGEL